MYIFLQFYDFILFFLVNFVNYSLNLDEDTFAQKHCCCKGENQS